jgi:5'-3' exonuclease
MGIPRFFAWVYQYYSSCLTVLKKDQTSKDVNIEVDCYELDVNAIIHPVCQEMYGYGSGKSERLLHRKKTPHDSQVFAAICNRIDKLLKIVNPKKQLMLAIDGSAGVSKQTQQRQRRFKSASEKKKSQTFDSNKITTGSEFMYNFSRYLHNYIQKKLNEDYYYKNLEVIFSNEKVVGEGEHKIIHHIKKNKNMSHCIHSPDADLIMLTVGLDNPNVYVIRENIYRDIDCEYFIVNVLSFRNIITSILKWTSVTHVFNSEQLIYDFILLCFLLGNDFLPHIPSLEISNNGLDLVLETYPRIASSYGHLVYRSKKTRELCLNLDALENLFRSLATHEKKLLTNKAIEKINFPDTLLIKNLQETINMTSNKADFVLNFDNYRIDYYEKRLYGCESYDVCTEYFKGMLFVLRYYIDEIPDWHWFYPFHYAPFFCDMGECINDFENEMKFEKHTPLNPFEQLLAVLPPQSSEILPVACRDLLLSDDSSISDFYPLKFEIDLEGKRQEWEGHPILPFIDVDRLKNAYKTVENKLSDNEKKRTIEGKIIKYFNNGYTVKTIFC